MVLSELRPGIANRGCHCEKLDGFEEESIKHGAVPKMRDFVPTAPPLTSRSPPRGRPDLAARHERRHERSARKPSICSRNSSGAVRNSVWPWPSNRCNVELRICSCW